jgi:hypothetical protein
MNASAETDKAAEQVDDDASAWIAETFDDCDGDWQSRFSAENMVTAYRSGFAAGLAYARKVFMEPPL